MRYVKSTVRLFVWAARLCRGQNRPVPADPASYDQSVIPSVITPGGAGPPSPASPARGARGPQPLWRHVLGERLRRLRHERGETLGEVATRAGVSPQYLSEIERGLKEPSSEMIAAVSESLEITLVDLTLAVAQTLHTAQLHAARGPAARAAFALAA